MSFAATAAIAIFAGVLLAVAFGPDIRRLLRRRAERDRRPRRIAGKAVRDPGRELRAERRAEQLLLSVVGQEGYEAYRALGFLHAYGSTEDPGGEPAYGYLIYPHKPIVSYDARSGELLSEHCVTFPDRTEDPGGELDELLPDADDVLAKWMALDGDERGLIQAANMHLPGRQLDPDHVRRDLARLSEWTGRSLRAEGRTEPR